MNKAALCFRNVPLDNLYLRHINSQVKKSYTETLTPSCCLCGLLHGLSTFPVIAGLCLIKSFYSSTWPCTS